MSEAAGSCKFHTDGRMEKTEWKDREEMRGVNLNKHWQVCVYQTCLLLFSFLFFFYMIRTNYWFRIATLAKHELASMRRKELCRKLSLSRFPLHHKAADFLRSPNSIKCDRELQNRHDKFGAFHVWPKLPHRVNLLFRLQKKNRTEAKKKVEGLERRNTAVKSRFDKKNLRFITRFLPLVRKLNRAKWECVFWKKKKKRQGPGKKTSPLATTTLHDSELCPNKTLVLSQCVGVRRQCDNNVTQTRTQRGLKGWSPNRRDFTI